MTSSRSRKFLISLDSLILKIPGFISSVHNFGLKENRHWGIMSAAVRAMDGERDGRARKGRGRNATRNKQGVP